MESVDGRADYLSTSPGKLAREFVCKGRLACRVGAIDCHTDRVWPNERRYPISEGGQHGSARSRRRLYRHTAMLRASDDRAAGIEPPFALGRSGVCESRWVGPSGAVARLGVVRAVRDSSGVRSRLRVLGMNRPGVHGGAGLAPAVGLIRSLSAVLA
jgi:hypothetical protein